MASLPPLLLISIGLVLIFLEISLYSFYIIWFGIAFIVVALIEYFFPLPSIWWQFALASGLALALFMFFYQPLKKFINQNHAVKDDFIQQQGHGIIKNQMLNYQGSYFKVVDTDISTLEGQLVNVIKVEKNNAWIEHE
jgi:membrane protein implicated in regulation of membrane protease activity